MSASSGYVGLKEEGESYKLGEKEAIKRDYYSLQVQLKAIQARFPSYYTKLINTKNFVQFPRPLPKFFFLGKP